MKAPAVQAAPALEDDAPEGDGAPVIRDQTTRGTHLFNEDQPLIEILCVSIFYLF